jgi:hypothetical protein
MGFSNASSFRFTIFETIDALGWPATILTNREADNHLK